MSDGKRPQILTLVVDSEGVILLWSKDGEELTGHEMRDVLGKTLDAIVPPAYTDRHWIGFRTAMATGTAEAEGAPINLPVLCADGSTKRFPTRFTLIRDVQGQALGAAAIISEPREGDPSLFEL